MLENADKANVRRAGERVKSEVPGGSRESLRDFAGGPAVEVEVKVEVDN